MATPLLDAASFGPAAAQSRFTDIDQMTDRVGDVSHAMTEKRAPQVTIPQRRTPDIRMTTERRRGDRRRNEKGADQAFVRSEFPDRVGVEMYNALNRDYQVRSGEVLAIDMQPATKRHAEKKGFQLIRSIRLNAVGISLDVLRPPDGMSIKRALKKLRKADPEGAYEPNSIFDGSSIETPALDDVFPAYIGSARLGLIDTGIHIDKPAFSHSKISQQNFGRGASITARDHGTYVAALSVRYGAGDLLIADAFSGDGEFTDAESLVRALNWMASEDVAVINMSLAGPANKLLEVTVARLIKRGHTIVAAVGNDGPDTPPQFPAAYPSVIGVTAIDDQFNVYEKANRGAGVDIASIGVNMSDGNDDKQQVSGTSFATPAIAAFLAQNVEHPEPGAPMRLGILVENLAIDLGEPGKDPIFGAGYLYIEPAQRQAVIPVHTE